jgi:hypothetical protein
MAVNAGVPPEGWSSSEVQRLRSAWDNSGGPPLRRPSYDVYNPKEIEDYEDKFRSYLDESGNVVQEEYASPEAPAKLIQIPTSSLNAERPRTVAAGYDETRGVMTVVFRDGTVYNYYSVTPDEWLGFYGSLSKGRPWLNKKSKTQGSDGLFISKPQGPADLTGISTADLKLFYSVSRNAQVRYSTKRMYRASAGSGKTTLTPRVRKNVHSRSKLSPNRRNAKGK